jgi:hypothetical protein
MPVRIKPKRGKGPGTIYKTPVKLIYCSDASAGAEVESSGGNASLYGQAAIFIVLFNKKVEDIINQKYVNQGELKNVGG